MFRDPHPLTYGKSAQALAACAWASAPSLRSLEHFGAALTVYTFDRGCYSSVGKLLKQYHRRQADDSCRDEKETEGILDFVIIVADPLHDCANGLEWGLKPFVGETTLKDLYVSIEAVRNSYDLLMTHMPQWLWQTAKPSTHTPEESVLHEMWGLLGVQEEYLEVLC